MFHFEAARLPGGFFVWVLKDIFYLCRVMIVDFRLKVFETVAELGSFTAAARKLGISQPAISNHINELEKQMQTKLVARSRAEVSLTENGRKFLSYVHQILHWYDAANAAFGLIPDTDSSLKPLTLKLSENRQAQVWSHDGDIHITLK